MQRLFVLLVACVISAVPANAQTARGSLQSELAETFGYYKSQTLSLDRIKQEFPALAPDAMRAQIAFDRVFKGAVENIDREIQQMFGAGWSEAAGRLENALSKSVRSSKLDNASAKSFIQAVNAHAKGDMESPVLQTLLSRVPEFRENPQAEFTRGYTAIYRSHDHTKAKGVDFQIQYPQSWVAKEGVRPNVVQLITSENGRGLDNIILMVRDTQLPPNYKVSAAEVEDLFSESGLKSMLPGQASFVSSQRVTLDSQKGGMVIYDMEVERVALNGHMRTISFFTLYKNKLIIIQGSTFSTRRDQAALTDRFKKLQPLFMLVANSFVLQSQY